MKTSLSVAFQRIFSGSLIAKFSYACAHAGFSVAQSTLAFATANPTLANPTPANSTSARKVWFAQAATVVSPVSKPSTTITTDYPVTAWIPKKPPTESPVTKPAELVVPVEPVELIEPVELVEPSKPAELIELVELAESVELIESVVSAETAETAETVESVTLIEPTKPLQTEESVASVATPVVTPVAITMATPLIAAVDTPGISSEVVTATQVTTQVATATEIETQITTQAATTQAATTQVATATPTTTQVATITKPATKTTTKSPTTPQASSRTKTIQRVAIIVVAAVIVAELAYLSLSGLGLLSGRQAEVSSDKTALLTGQLNNNKDRVIPDIGYDSALTIENYGSYVQYLVSVGSLTKLSNNYLAITGKGSDAQTVLIDETAVGRIIAFNANWVAFLNGNGNAVMQDVAKDSRAQEVVKAYDEGFQIIFHRLAIGEIYQNGSTVYILAQPCYTVVKDGRSKEFNDVVLYKLTRQGDTLVISDMEALTLASQGGGSSP